MSPATITLISLFIHVTPIILLVFLALEIYIRDRTNLLHRLVSGIFLAMAVIFSGTLLMNIFPADNVLFLMIALTFIPAVSVMSFAVHLSLRLTPCFEHWSSRKVFLLSYLPFSGPAVLLVFPELVQYSIEKNGPWNVVSPNMTMLSVILIPAVYAVSSVFFYFRAGIRYVKQTETSDQQVGQLRALINAFTTGGTACIMITFANEWFSTLFQPLNLPALSNAGVLFFAIMVRLAMTKYHFLPSIEHRNKILFAHSPIAILLLDSKGFIVESNPAASQLFAMTNRQLLHKSVSEVLSPYNGIPSPPSMWGELRATISADGISRIIDLDREFVTAGSRKYEFLLLKDITEQVAAQERITQMAYQDPLTGLGNRRHFQETLSRMLTSSNQPKTAVFLMDLDRFKQINDAKGHRIGDQLLQQTAKYLLHCAPEAKIVARLGGDEFVIAVHYSLHEEVRRLAQRIVQQFKQPIPSGEEEFIVTPSIGICLSPDFGTDAEGLLHYADIAMYEAKRNGRHAYVFFDNTHLNAERRKRTLENKLQTALQKNELSLYYQPQIDLSTGAVHGAEVLLRWADGEGASISPNEFIPIAEASGMIIPIGRWVLHQACIAGKSWIDAGLGEMSLAVNVSFREMLEPGWLDHLKHVLQQTGFPSHLLHLEVTERSIMPEEEEIHFIFRQAHELGIRLAIDDFGTGYAAFSVLQALPFQLLKIDHTIIRNTLTDNKTKSIALAMISMAHSMGLKVTAEGVEEPEQLEFLRKAGCDMVQGYYFSKPVPGVQFLEWQQAYYRNRSFPIASRAL